MDFQDVAFLYSWGSFCTTFIKTCDEVYGLRITTCIKIVVGGK